MESGVRVNFPPEPRKILQPQGVLMLMVIMKRDGTLTKPPMQQAQANNYLKKLINANRYASLGRP